MRKEVNGIANQTGLGFLLALTWAAGLYGALEADSLLTKAIILVLLAPLSLFIDRLLNRHTLPAKSLALNPVRQDYTYCQSPRFLRATLSGHSLSQPRENRAA